MIEAVVRRKRKEQQVKRLDYCPDSATVGKYVFGFNTQDLAGLADQEKNIIRIIEDPLSGKQHLQPSNNCFHHTILLEQTILNKSGNIFLAADWTVWLFALSETVEE